MQDNTQSKITRPQMKLLHALWNLQSFDDDDREQRLQWASRNCGRTVTSFNELNKGEFRKLADALSMGLDETKARR